MKKINALFFIIVSGFFASCSQETKQNLGFVKQMPDEYKVVKHGKLKLPKKTELPKPGRPMDMKRKRSVTRKTSALLLNKSGGAKQPLHTSEKAFLTEVGVSGNKEIYKKLSHDSEKSSMKEKQWQSKVKDTIFFWKKTNKKKANVINAEDEAKNIELNQS